ncbi:hypothetical protein [Puerhibacterium puerhi]|uniref:hypothetical protein n=1 Tax=Puerhibacterium puerhi TaxID=2692623 RepID=UPI0013567935|nr:hypothetical protein [Puerhibacterium puerhi]
MTTRTPATRVSFAGVLAAEWTKLVGLRSTLWVALGTALAAASLAYGLSLFAGRGDGPTGVSLVVAGSVLAQTGALALGALVGAGEHSSGAATATFTAVPRRLPVLAAQAVVTGAGAGVTAAAALAASALATTDARTRAGLVLELADPETARMLAGFVLHLVGVALLGLGLGALLRRPGAVIVAGVILLVVVDQLLATNPGQVTDTLRAALPGAGARLLLDDAALAALDAASRGPRLGAWGGGLVLAGWAVGALAAGAGRLCRGDVTR